MAERKSAVVAGGTGSIGEGIVKSLLDGGWSVYVPSRGAESSSRFQERWGSDVLDRLSVLPADLSVPAEVAGFRAKVVAAAGRVDLVVVSVGSSYYGYSLHKIAQQEWVRLLTENLQTHFLLQHEFLAQLHSQNQGTYITLTGPESDFAHPDTGLMSVFAAAQKMMARVEAVETSGTSVRAYSVTSKTPIATRSRGAQSGADWIHAEELGLYVRRLAEGSVPGTDEPVHVLDDQNHLKRLLRT